MLETPFRIARASLAVLVAFPGVAAAQHTFDDDVAFLRQRLEVVVQHGVLAREVPRP